MFSLFRKSPVRPDAAAAMRRIFILKHVFVKALATPPSDAIEQWSKIWSHEDFLSFESGFRSQFAKQEKQIRDAGLWAEMGKEEQEFIQTGVIETTERQRIDASWLVESVVCILWALGRVEQVPGYDEETSHERMNFSPGASLQEVVKTSRLRPSSEIEKQRSLAELWHWRCRTRKLLDSESIPKTLRNGMTMDEVIRLSAEMAASEGAFPAVIDGDFPAFGRPFREATVEEFARLTSIAQERHKAFNWLCGFAKGNQWAETPTDT